MKGYKLVTRSKHDDLFLSYLGFGFLGNDYQYELNEITNRPKNWGPLSLFDNIEHLQDFVKKEHIVDFKKTWVYTVLECEYTPSKETTLYKIQNDIKVFADKIIEGTVFADSVIPLKEIDVGWNKNTGVPEGYQGSGDWDD